MNEALQKWLSWEGNFLKVKYLPDGLSFSSDGPEWLVELSAPLGSYKGACGSTLDDAIINVNHELAKRNKSKS